MIQEPRWTLPCRLREVGTWLSYANELPPGGVQSLEYVGRKLVIFRTEDGHAGAR